MHKLNVWHRLAIVVTVLWLLAAPTYVAVRQSDSAYRAHEAMRDYCLRQVETGPVENYVPGIAKCWEDWQRDIKTVDRWDGWPSLFGAAFAVAAVFWVLFGAAFYTVKWILAGRQPKST